MRMVNQLPKAIAAMVLLAIPNLEARAQGGAGAGGIGLGYSDVAAVLGLGGLGEASLAVGGRYERIIKALPDMGDGLLGIRAGVDWYSVSLPGCSYSSIPISGTGNYHFKMENKKFDPFVGAGLGFLVASGCAGVSYSSGIYFLGVIGMRYFLSESMAFYADAGAGYGALHVGLSWKLGGGS